MKFAKMLMGTASALAASINLPAISYTAPKADVTRQRGAKGTAFSRLCQYERTGPFYRQVGVQDNGKPKMKAYMVHRFLHPTKGWRTYTDIPGVMLRAIDSRAKLAAQLTALAKRQPLNRKNRRALAYARA